MLFNPAIYVAGSSSSGTYIPWNVIEPWAFWSDRYSAAPAAAALSSATIILDHAFDQTDTYAYRMSSMKTISAPECMYVGNYAFANNRSLSSVYIPKCEYVGDSAFFYAWNASFSLSSLKYIGDRAFAYCHSLPSIYYLASTCKSVGAQAFFQTNIAELHLPSGFTEGTGSLRYCYLGAGAFQTTYMSKLYCDADYITADHSNNYGQFAYNASLTYVSCPNLSRIPMLCFEFCSILSSVSFPKVHNIGSAALAIAECLQIYRHLNA